MYGHLLIANPKYDDQLSENMYVFQGQQRTMKENK